MLKTFFTALASSLIAIMAWEALHECKAPLQTPVHREGFWRVAAQTPNREGMTRVQYVQDTCTACPNRLDGNEKFSWWLPSASVKGLSVTGWAYGHGKVTDTSFTLNTLTPPDPIRARFPGSPGEAVALTLKGGAE